MGILDRFKKKPATQPVPHQPERKIEAVQKKTTEVKKAEPKKVEPKKAEAKKTPVRPTHAAKKKYPESELSIIKPIITEKATNLSADRKYIFEVATGANRIEIAKAVQSLYGVQPVKVNIIRQGGKQIRYGRAEGRTKDRKKAIVTLREGESIKIQDGV